MCGVVGDRYYPESCFLSNSFDDGGCKVFIIEVVLVVYCDSTLVWVKDDNASSV